MMPGLTLDAGALIALERGNRNMALLLRHSKQTGSPVTIPATVLAQVIREPRRQVGIMRVVRHAATDVVPLNQEDAERIGRVLAASRTSDITDAHVVLCARRAGQPVVTSDPDDLRRLTPTIELVTI